MLIESCSGQPTWEVLGLQSIGRPRMSSRAHKPSGRLRHEHFATSVDLVQIKSCCTPLVTCSYPDQDAKSWSISSTTEVVFFFTAGFQISACYPPYFLFTAIRARFPGEHQFGRDIFDPLSFLFCIFSKFLKFFWKEFTKSFFFVQQGLHCELQEAILPSFQLLLGEIWFWSARLPPRLAWRPTSSASKGLEALPRPTPRPTPHHPPPFSSFLLQSTSIFLLFFSFQLPLRPLPDLSPPSFGLPTFRAIFASPWLHQLHASLSKAIQPSSATGSWAGFMMSLVMRGRSPSGRIQWPWSSGDGQRYLTFSVEISKTPRRHFRFRTMTVERNGGQSGLFPIRAARLGSFTNLVAQGHQDPGASACS